MSDFEEVLKINSSIASFYDNYARALREAHRFDDALRAENHAIQMAPKYAFLYYGKAKIIEAQGNPAEALQVTADALRVEPNNAGVWEYRGKLFGLLSRFTEAFAAFDRALEIEPNRNHVFITRADVKRRQGKTEEAIADLRLYPANGDAYKEAQEKIAEFGGTPAQLPLTVTPAPPSKAADETTELSLGPDRYWAVLASRQDPDEAIALALNFSNEKAFVAHAINGWHAVLIGPFPVASGDGKRFVEALVREKNVPPDAYLANGASFDSVTWKRAAEAVVATLSYDGEHNSSLRNGDLEISLTKTAPHDGQSNPVATGTYKGREAFRLEISENSNEKPSSEARLIRLDPLSPEPSVVFTYYWQGAHCCTVTKIATMRSDGTWRTVEADTLDGGGYGFEDLEGTGSNFLISSDNSFLYAFSSYADSVAPIRIQQIKDGQLIDVTHDARFNRRVKQDYYRIVADGNSENLHSNGYLAGYVASASLANMGVDEAWSKMLRGYDRDSDVGLETCEAGENVVDCPASQKRKLSYPAALKEFLVRHSYLSGSDATRLAVPSEVTPSVQSTYQAPPESEPIQLKTCASVSDTVRKIVTGIFTDRSSKDVFDYGSVTLENDTTFESFDPTTTKVTCAVTYHADLRPLIGYLAQEGNYRKAQTLGRLATRNGGPVVSHRVKYTVKPTASAGTSFIEILP